MTELAPVPPTPPADLSRRAIRRLAAGLVAAVLIAVASVAGAYLATADGADEPAPAQTTGAWEREQQARQAATAEKEPAAEETATSGPTLSAADLKLTPKVVKKQCYGSAGCNVTVEIEAAYGGPALSEDDTWRVVYEITGDESGPIIGSFELVRDRYDKNEVSLSTKSSKTKIGINATEIERQG